MTALGRSKEVGMDMPLLTDRQCRLFLKEGASDGK